MIFALKLSAWKQLPLLMAGLADHDMGLARECANQCLRLYEHHAGQEHPLTAQLLSQGSSLRKPLQDFAAGTLDIHDSKPLASFVAKFRCIPTAERAVEAMHATMGRLVKGARHYSPVYVIVKQSMTFLTDRLQRHPQHLENLCILCDSFQDPWKIVRACGFENHPVLRSMRAHVPPLSVSKQRRTIIDVLYHCDAQTQYADMNAVREHLGHTASVHDRVDAWKGDLLLWHACEHLRQQLAAHPQGLFRLKLSEDDGAQHDAEELLGIIGLAAANERHQGRRIAVCVLVGGSALVRCPSGVSNMPELLRVSMSGGKSW